MGVSLSFPALAEAVPRVRVVGEGRGRRVHGVARRVAPARTAARRNVVGDVEVLEPRVARERALEVPARKSNLQPECNVRVIDASISAVLRALDESRRFVQ